MGRDAICSNAIVVVNIVCGSLLTTHSRETLLSEVHDSKDVTAVLFGVPHPEVEPLLMTSGISIHLHVKLILGGINDLGLKKVAAFKYRVKEEDVIVIL